MTIEQSLFSKRNRDAASVACEKNRLNLKQSILIIAESTVTAAQSVHVPRPIVERLATPDHLFVVKDKDSAFFRTSDTFYALFPHVNSAVIISKEMSALVQKYVDKAIKLGLDSYLVITNLDQVSQLQKMRLAIMGVSVLSIEEFVTETGL